MPDAQVVKSKVTNRVLCTRQHFTGSLSAKDIRAELKAGGVKGKELTRRVNQTLSGEKNMRDQLGAAWLQAAIQDGYTCDKGELRKNTGNLRLVKVTEVKKEEVKATTVEQALEALGLSADMLETIKAMKSLDKKNIVDAQEV